MALPLKVSLAECQPRRIGLERLIPRGALVTLTVLATRLPICIVTRPPGRVAPGVVSRPLSVTAPLRGVTVRVRPGWARTIGVSGLVTLPYPFRPMASAVALMRCPTSLAVRV